MGVLTVHPSRRRRVVPSMVMDNRVEVREFLTSRRAKISPEQAGLPVAGQRRVPGLRRSEVAALAGMSVEYYAKLERGALGRGLGRRARRDRPRPAARRRRTRPSAAPGARGRRQQRGPAPRRRPEQWTVRPSLQWTLDAITTAPAIVGNNRLDLLAANHLGRAMYCDLYADPTSAAELRPVHLPRQRRPPVLPRLGPRRRHDRGQPAHRRRQGPPRQGPARPRRRAVHPQRRVPPPLGRPQRAHPRQPASNTSTTTSSATSPSPTKASTCAPNPASP